MAAFVELHLIGSGQVVFVNPEQVTFLQEFDSGRGGIGTTLKFTSGDTVNVKGTVSEVLATLQRQPLS